MAAILGVYMVMSPLQAVFADPGVAVENLFIDEPEGVYTFESASAAPHQMYAEVVPDNAENTVVHWTTSDPYIVTVDENGLVTPHHAGSTWIYAYSDEDSQYGAWEQVDVSGIGLPDHLVVGLDQTDKKVEPEYINYIESEPEYSIADESIAAVAADGTLEPKELGHTTVTVTDGEDSVTTDLYVVDRLGDTQSPAEGSLLIYPDPSGRMSIDRYDGEGWVMQVYNTAGEDAIYDDDNSYFGTSLRYEASDKGSLLKVGDTYYSLGYFDGPFDEESWGLQSLYEKAVLESYTKDAEANTMTLVWNCGDQVEVTQTISYEQGKQYYDSSWTFHNLNDYDLSDVKFFHGNDTYLAGGDEGEGFWDEDNQAVGVKKTLDDGGMQVMTLTSTGQAPAAYASGDYQEDVFNPIVNDGALTDAVNPDPETDNGYALEWDTASLLYDEDWTLSARESFVIDTESDSGEVSNPEENSNSYIIMTPEDLDNMRLHPDADFKLGADIDMDSYLAETESGWEPVGSYDASNGDLSNAFTGTLDGNGHTISGLWTSDYFGNNIGLFGATKGATIKNLNLSNVYMEGSKNVGSLVGLAVGTTVDHVTAAGTVYGNGGFDDNSDYVTTNNVGGLIGYAKTMDAQPPVQTVITNSGSSVDVQTNAQSHDASDDLTQYLEYQGNHATGGLIGYADNVVVAKSYAKGSVTSNMGIETGGFIGYAKDVDVSESYSSGPVVGIIATGGFFGSLDISMPHQIVNNYSISDVQGYTHYADDLGGLVGFITGNVPSEAGAPEVISHNHFGGKLIYNDYYASTSIHMGLAYGDANLYSDYEGAFEFDHNYVNSENVEVIDGITLSPTEGFAYEKTTDEMRQQSTFDSGSELPSDWDFATIWEMSTGDNYNQGFPVFQWQNPALVSGITTSAGELDFDASNLSYTLNVDNSVSNATFTINTAQSGGAMTINDQEFAAGEPSSAFDLQEGDNVFTIYVQQDGRNVTYTVTIHRGAASSSSDNNSSDDDETDVPSSSSSGSSSSSSGGTVATPTDSTEKIEVSVDMGNGQSEVSKAVIERTTDANGVKKDKVTLTQDQAKEAVTKAKDANQPVVRIVIPDANDEVSETQVNVPKAALSEVQAAGKDLEIYTENGSVIVPSSSMADFNDDLYFRLVPVKAQTEQDKILNRAVKEDVVTTISKDLAPYVVSRPMTIETNMESRPVTLVLPLRDVTMPTNAQEKQTFLNSLAIYIEHEDGTKEVKRGTVVEYGNGQLGLQFDTDKFSTFTILSWDGQDLTAHHAYIKGYTDGTFKPEKATTRAEMAMMLARNLGYTQEANSSKVYPDVAATHWANGAIAFVKEKGLMVGDDNGNFRPEAAVTRAEMAVIAANYKQMDPLAGDASKGAFSDTDGHWAAGYIAAIKNAGIVNGYENGTYAPNKQLTRAETVTVLNKLFERGPLYGVQAGFWSDVADSNWAYANIMEASFSHDFDVRAEGGEQVK
ncbi:S-layer homology domain-containing protein [Paenibacillus pinistramenti]|uniref:S-layer homology domain-containing protein n=1 Tax=Paenibacillus pinistramenti TaxID=1768003 RepID=UPI0013969B84|nr:S-layer homology domain-containing protein [Paenibacillus pinistramenti]